MMLKIDLEKLSSCIQSILFINYCYYNYCAHKCEYACGRQRTGFRVFPSIL